MKISCTQENLAKGLSIVGRSVGNRTSLPVLNNILLKTEKGGLKLSATDLEIGINTWIGAKVDAEGAITLPAKLLLDFVNANNDKKIDLLVDELKVKVTSDHYKANINGIDAAEFPLIPQVKKTSELEIPASIFAKAISKTIIAAALDESRPVLAGVFFKAKDNTLKMVSTDSYRLAEQTISLSKKVEGEVSFIVPSRTMAELSRIISDGIDKVVVAPSDNQVEFQLGETTLVSRLIEGIFPEYEQILPKETKTTVTLNTPELASALKMASLFAKESANNVRLKITGPDKLSILAISPHLGDNTSEIGVQVTGSDLEIAFNAKFILDVLSVIGSDKVKIEFSGNMAPGLLKSEKDANYLYVIMPLRIDE